MSSAIFSFYPVDIKTIHLNIGIAPKQRMCLPKTCTFFRDYFVFSEKKEERCLLIRKKYVPLQPENDDDRGVAQLV